MSDKELINLLGKDYLTVIEAAHYAGVSVAQFNRHRKAYGITPRRFMGKVLYRKADLQAAIEADMLDLELPT